MLATSLAPFFHNIKYLYMDYMFSVLVEEQGGVGILSLAFFLCHKKTHIFSLTSFQGIIGKYICTDKAPVTGASY